MFLYSFVNCEELGYEGYIIRGPSVLLTFLFPFFAFPVFFFLLMVIFISRTLLRSCNCQLTCMMKLVSVEVHLGWLVDSSTLTLLKVCVSWKYIEQLAPKSYLLFHHSSMLSILSLQKVVYYSDGSLPENFFLFCS